MMTKLPNIEADRSEPAIAAIMPVFEDCCRYIASHSQPLETLSVLPTLDELKTAWTNVQAAVAAWLEPDLS